jgi:hypothetical protein
MRPLINPFMPTPLGLAYYLPKWSTGEAVEFDGRDQKSGTMIDYKDKYWDMLKSPASAKLSCATLLIRRCAKLALQGQRPIRWYFSEKESCGFRTRSILF